MKLSLIVLMLIFLNSNIKCENYIHLNSNLLNFNSSYIHTDINILEKEIILEIPLTFDLIERKRLFIFSLYDEFIFKYVYAKSINELSNVKYFHGEILTKSSPINYIDIDLDFFHNGKILYIIVSPIKVVPNLSFEISFQENKFISLTSQIKSRSFFSLKKNEKFYILITNNQIKEIKDSIFFYRTHEGSLNIKKYYYIEDISYITSLSQIININKKTKGIKFSESSFLLPKEILISNSIIIELSSSINYPVGYFYFGDLIKFDDKYNNKDKIDIEINNFNILYFTSYIKIIPHMIKNSFLKVINIFNSDDKLFRIQYKDKLYNMNELLEINLHISDDSEEVKIMSFNESNEIQIKNNQYFYVFIELYEKLDQSQIKVNYVSEGRSDFFSNYNIISVIIPSSLENTNTIILDTKNGMFDHIEYSVHRYYKREGENNIYEIYDYLKLGSSSSDINNLFINKFNKSTYFKISIDDVVDTYILVLYIKFNNKKISNKDEDKKYSINFYSQSKTKSDLILNSNDYKIKFNLFNSHSLFINNINKSNYNENYGLLFINSTNSFCNIYVRTKDIDRFIFYQDFKEIEKCTYLFKLKKGHEEKIIFKSNIDTQMKILLFCERGVYNEVFINYFK